MSRLTPVFLLSASLRRTFQVVLLLCLVVAPAAVHGQTAVGDATVRLGDTTATELFIGTNSNGDPIHVMPVDGTFVSDRNESPVEEAFLHLNGTNAVLASPGDSGLLQIWDTDLTSDAERFRINDLSIHFTGSFSNAREIGIQSTAGDADLVLTTPGALLRFETDVDNDTSQFDVMDWRNNGSATGDRVMALSSGGTLQIAAGLVENVSFDVAEAFLREGPLEAGDLVMISSRRHDAVARARAGAGTAVLGVVSTLPGVLLGGSAFSLDRVEKNWGSDVARQFESERDEIKSRLLERHESLRTQRERLYDFSEYVSTTRWADRLEPTMKPEDQARLEEEYRLAVLDFEDTLEGLAIGEFVERVTAPIALAGRVPVKVDLGYGQIAAGDPLTLSDRAGLARKATEPGPIIGVALESSQPGSQKLWMFVQPGWRGGVYGARRSSTETPTHETEERIAKLRAENVLLAEENRLLLQQNHLLVARTETLETVIAGKAAALKDAR